jgi:hypothetical protein
LAREIHRPVCEVENLSLSEYSEWLAVWEHEDKEAEKRAKEAKKGRR